jgi:RNA polymerase sigma-70 factor (ECF subfamily)
MRKTISQVKFVFKTPSIAAPAARPRVVFVMHQVEGLSNPEIATCLKLSDSNVKVRLHRAKKLLKEELYKNTHDASIYEFGNQKCDLMVEMVMVKIQNI